MGLLFVMGALAQGVPKRVIPPSVRVEVQELENAFALALATDCDASRCYSKGCTYVDHAVADRGRSSSMPGLSQEAGPGSEPAQEYLTRARCSYAHEEALDAQDVKTLNLRLQSKVSSGWTSVTVSNQPLQALPPYLRDPVVLEEEALPEPEKEELPPEPLSLADELWSALLPHFFWMLGLLLATLSAMTLIWGWRRLGRLSPEDQALLAELGEPEPEELPEPIPAVVVEASGEDGWVSEQKATWQERLDRKDDPMLRTLVTDLLRGEDRALLVQALLHFPGLAGSFPSGGDVATDKLELAALIRSAEMNEADDAAFFERLNRHALSAELGAQSDADTLRSLKQDFGAAGLAELIARVPPRIGGLLFALAPLSTQLETSRLLVPKDLHSCAQQLLLSNRMDRDEAAWLFALLDSAQTGRLPDAPAPTQVRDQGPVFDAAGALSTLLPRLGSASRGTLFGEVGARFGGSLPSWHADILFADLLFALSDEARADLLLSVDVDALKAWLGVVPADSREMLVETMPNALKATVMGPAPALNAERVKAGRRSLALGFQRQLRRAGLSFEEAVAR